MINPLLWLELRVRVRERRLWVVALFYLLVPLLVCLLGMAMMLQDQALVDPAEVGMMIAMGAIFCQAGLLILLAPLAAAQRIAQEREQRTLPALVNSPLRPAAMARGKLAGAVIFTFWLGLLTLPLLVAAALWGGFPMWALGLCCGLNLLAGMTLSSLALGLSGLFGRSLSAYLAVGALLFFWCLALPAIGGLVMGLIEAGWSPGSAKTVFSLFFLHHPLAPQIWTVMRAGGEPATYTEWGLWVPLTGLGSWALLAWIGFRAAGRGLGREVV